MLPLDYAQNTLSFFLTKSFGLFRQKTLSLSSLSPQIGAPKPATAMILIWRPHRRQQHVPFPDFLSEAYISDVDFATPTSICFSGVDLQHVKDWMEVRTLKKVLKEHTVWLRGGAQMIVLAVWSCDLSTSRLPESNQSLSASNSLDLTEVMQFFLLIFVSLYDSVNPNARYVSVICICVDGSWFWFELQEIKWRWRLWEFKQ